MADTARRGRALVSADPIQIAKCQEEIAVAV
jgi:hypothetical protein